MPNKAWPLLTALVINAPDRDRVLVEQGFWPGELPNLASVELSNLYQQNFTTLQPSVTSLVLHSMRGMLYEFQQLLRSLPNLESLEVDSDLGGRPPLGQGRPMLWNRFPMRSLHTLHISDSHGLCLGLFYAPALRHFHYRAIRLIRDHIGRTAVKEMREPVEFIVASSLSSHLETLTVRIHPALTVNDRAVQAMVDGLVALRHLSLDIRQRNAYHGLRYFQPGVPLNLGALRTARFQISRADSARDVTYFAEFHPWVETVEMTWIVEEGDAYRLRNAERDGVEEQFRKAAKKGQDWCEVGPGHYRLSR